MTKLDGKRAFPCPLCKDPLDVRESKKKKPYVVCDRCGVQMFVRNRAGISAFDQLVERAEAEDLWTELSNLGKRYRLQCPKCGRKFWVEQKLIKTSELDGSFYGFRCPEKGCGAITKWEK